MKNKFRSFTLLFVLVLLALVPSALAQQQERVDVYEGGKLAKSVVFVIGRPEYFVDGRLPGVKMDVAPFIENDRTFVPVRFLGNALGVKDENIYWDGDSQRVTLAEPGLPRVELAIGVAGVTSNGAPVPGVDVAPRLVDPGRTMLPARFVAEALGYQVEWDEDLGLVVCWPKGGQKPDVSAVRTEVASWEWTEGGYRLPRKNGPLVNQELTARFGGYTIWTKAGLEIDAAFMEPEAENIHNVDIQLLIMPPDYKGSWEAYDQAEAVLASKFGGDFASEVMSLVRQKKARWDLMDLPRQVFRAPDGQKVSVGFGEGAHILVYR